MKMQTYKKGDKMVKRLLVALSLGAIFFISMVEIAQALPTFSRQTGYACNVCHTVFPRLTKTGMLFKLNGYTEGNAIPSFDIGEGKSVLRYIPVSVRLLSFPYSKEKGNDVETIFPEEFMIAIAGKIVDNVGAYIQPVFEGEEDEWGLEVARVAFVHTFGNSIVGFTGGVTSPVGTDPFNTLDPLRRLTRQTSSPHHRGIRQSGLSDMFGGNNRGWSLYALIDNMLYLNAGLYNGLSQNPNGDRINRGFSDPVDFYGRVAFLPPTNAADINVGLFTYLGKEKYSEGEAINRFTGNNFADNKPRTYGLDFGIIKNFGDVTSEVVGFYLVGKDRPRDAVTGEVVEVTTNGASAWGILYYKNKVALTVGYGWVKFDDPNPFQFADGSTGEPDQSDTRRDTTVNLSYLFRPNIRLGIEYNNTDWKNNPDTNLLSLLLDISF